MSEDRRRELLPRFMAEAQAAAAIEHENVVRFIEYGLAKEEQIPYLVMEYVEGQSLKSIIRESDVELKLEEKVHLLRQMVAALVAIHAADVCHRDVKPSNVLVDAELNVKLIDFGIARLPDSELTMTHNILGSPSYMAPEAFITAKVDHRADLFSLGIVAYELFVGSKPFEGKNFLLLGKRITSARPAEPRKLDPDISPSLQAFLAMLLKKSPDDRFATAAEALAALDSLARPQSSFGRLRCLARNVMTGDWS
jgi:serine/threonine-protein kinase